MSVGWILFFIFCFITDSGASYSNNTSVESNSSSVVPTISWLNSSSIFIEVTSSSKISFPTTSKEPGINSTVATETVQSATQNVTYSESFFPDVTTSFPVFPDSTVSTPNYGSSSAAQHQSSSAAQHQSSSIKPKPAVVVKYECGLECKSLKRRLWAAGFFAVLFGVTTVLFVILLFRQYRFTRDENDPALARLI